MPTPSASPSPCRAVSEADLANLVEKSAHPDAGEVSHSGKGWAVPVDDGWLVAVTAHAPGVDDVGVWRVKGIGPLAGPVVSANVTAEVLTAWPRVRSVDTGPVEACF